jgi:hypothetical protein
METGVINMDLPEQGWPTILMEIISDLTEMTLYLRVWQVTTASMLVSKQVNTHSPNFNPVHLKKLLL